jgi:hypothetical protein
MERPMVRIRCLVSQLFAAESPFRTSPPPPHLRQVCEGDEQDQGEGHAAPPAPKRTPCARRLAAISQYSSLISIPMALREANFAATKVVPDPINGSMTVELVSLHHLTSHATCDSLRGHTCADSLPLLLVSRNLPGTTCWPGTLFGGLPHRYATSDPYMRRPT